MVWAVVLDRLPCCKHTMFCSSNLNPDHNPICNRAVLMMNANVITLIVVGTDLLHQTGGCSSIIHFMGNINDNSKNRQVKIMVLLFPWKNNSRATSLIKLS